LFVFQNNSGNVWF